MIRHICDYCGRETTRGASIPDQRIYRDFDLTKRWKTKDPHTEYRTTRVAVLVGIDDTNPGPDHPSAALCLRCQIRLVESVLDNLREAAV